MADEKLKRVAAGSYRTPDERFTVEQSSSGWVVIDGSESNELGLPLARGPFATLDDARAAILAARAGPEPPSPLPLAAKRSAPRAAAGGPPRHAPRRGDREARPEARPERRRLEPPERRSTRSKAPPTPAVIIREWRQVDGEALRELWRDAGFRSLGDDDLSLARLARRNPGLVLVASEAGRIVGSALGAWDGRRGWIYHVATARDRRRRGIAARLVAKVEEGLRELGCPKVNVIVREGNDDGARFWRALGYETTGSVQHGKDLRPG